VDNTRCLSEVVEESDAFRYWAGKKKKGRMTVGLGEHALGSGISTVGDPMVGFQVFFSFFLFGSFFCINTSKDCIT